MTTFTNRYWRTAISRMDYAMQPIINIHNGSCYGMEALLRGVDSAGFQSIADVFDRAYQDGVLHETDLLLREKALEKFTAHPEAEGIKLFFNLDNRILVSSNYETGETKRILDRLSLPEDTICFEISERNRLVNVSETLHILDAYRSQGFKIALDDCGTGFSGLQLLYYTKPDLIKIDRFFIDGIANDLNKRLLVSSIVNIAHLTGSLVVAEGVETPQEFFACRDIGCDLVQGFLVQPPETEIQLIKTRYDHIRILTEKDRRSHISDDKDLIKMEIEYLEPISARMPVLEVFERFRNRKPQSFYPVVNQNSEPIGVVFESSFKDYAYSRFGRELLENQAYGGDLRRFVSRFPIAEIHTSAEKILEIFSRNRDIEGILIVEGMKYAGFLSAHSLLRVLNEKNLAIARDQNPLTKLPGNTLIYSFVSKALEDTATQYVVVYFDFDNFKPYNDTYGFRSGDRVIQLFSDLLKSQTQGPDHFAGHIGGDDFFMGIKAHPLEEAQAQVKEIIGAFKRNVESFYDPDALHRGYIRARNRKGQEEEYPLLTASAVMVELPVFRSRIYSADDISGLIARHKKGAKNSPEKCCLVSIRDLDEAAAEKLRAFS
jgi:diguanylate cyclase (GGDEF)-like protein